MLPPAITSEGQATHDNQRLANLEPKAITLESIEAPVDSASGVSITQITYSGWPDSYLLSNGIVEAIVVPAIGRVMQLRFIGDSAGTFWENHELHGELHRSASSEWLNFGGEKCWPAPQSTWQLHQDRAWPPPSGFDPAPMQAIVTEDALELSSAIDPGWGIQIVRRIELTASQPVLRIQTEDRKLHGPPVEVAIWTIAQMREPERVCMLLDLKSKLVGSYVHLLAAEPAELRIQGTVLSIGRHRRTFTKIGADGSSLAWIGPTCVVRIDVEPMPGKYPDGGCLTEIYTNPDPLAYVELETLSSLTTMSIGDRIPHIATYTVTHRSTRELLDEAQRAFSRGSK